MALTVENVECPQTIRPAKEVLSMEVTPDDSWEHYYRIRFGDSIKYVTVEPGTYDYEEVLSFPPILLERLPAFPDGGWVSARVARSDNPGSGGFRIELSYEPLKGIDPKKLWHHNRIEILSLGEVGRLRAACRLVQYGTSIAVAKIARFDWEIQYLEAETCMYEKIEGRNIGPTFFGHLMEHGRAMGILLEYIQGRHAGPSDIAACEDVVGKLHTLGLCHGDLNRHNFVVSDDGTKLIDFEGTAPAGPIDMEKELAELPDKLADESGLGGEVEEGSDEEV